MKAGIIDSGFDEHEDITVNLEEKISFLKYKYDVFIDENIIETDVNGDHGSKIAGIIDANHNGQGINGICKKAQSKT